MKAEDGLSASAGDQKDVFQSALAPLRLVYNIRYILRENIYPIKICGGVGDKSPVGDLGVDRKPSLTTELEN